MSRKLSIEDTIIPKIIRDKTNIFKVREFKNIKPTYKSVHLIEMSRGVNIDCHTLKKLFERIIIYLGRTLEENYRMTHNYEKFEELDGLSHKELEEMMIILIDLGFPVNCLLWVASDIGRSSGTKKYDPLSIKNFNEEVHKYIKSLASMGAF
jgi:hypothetical protein